MMPWPTAPTPVLRWASMIPPARHNVALWQRAPRRVTLLRPTECSDHEDPPSTEDKRSPFPTATQVDGATHETAERLGTPLGRV